MNATHLLIKDYTEPCSLYKCCICGANADGSLLGRDYFGDTFSDYRLMAYPGSDYICTPCAVSLKDVPSGRVSYIDGSVKLPKSEKRGLGWRFFSWVLVEGKEPVGATKAHCAQLVDALRHPPLKKYFAIIIADSGQKQLIYRLQAQKIHSPETPFYVQFETRHVCINNKFWGLMNIANKISAIVGKSRVMDPLSYNDLSLYLERYGDEAYNEYMYFKQNIKTAECALSAWLCENPKKGEKQ